MNPSIIVMTDMDGTLLDHHDYSYEAAKPALEKLRESGIPVILNSSKTQAELDRYRIALGLDNPVVIENGAAIYFPTDMQDKQGLPPCIKFGMDRAKILHILHELREHRKWKFRGFADMSIDEVIAYTGLSEAEAKLAMQRDFSEPLIWDGSDEEFEQFSATINDRGLSLTRGGRFIHVSAPVNKGQSLEWLREFFSSADSVPVVIALGDSENDVEMLMASDYPVLIKSPVKSFPQVSHPELTSSEKTGAEGWNESVIALLDKIQNTEH